MANAQVTYTATGSTDTWSFAFPYLDTDHVKLYLDGVEDTGATFPTSGSIQASGGNPANGVVVLVKRETPSSALVVNIPNSGSIRNTDINNQSLQALYVAAEGADSLENTMELDASATYWDGDTKRIKGVVDPTDDQDVATKAYADTIAATAVSAAAASAVAAAASASAASTSAGNAATSASNASTAETNAEAAQTAAEAAQTAAEAALAAIPSDVAIKSEANVFSTTQIISTGAAGAILRLQADAGNNRVIQSRTGSSLRWQQILGNTTAEGGSNAGSDYSLSAYDDAGSLIGAALSIRRSDLRTTFGGRVFGPSQDPSDDDEFARKAYVDANTPTLTYTTIDDYAGADFSAQLNAAIAAMNATDGIHLHIPGRAAAYNITDAINPILASRFKITGDHFATWITVDAASSVSTIFQVGSAVTRGDFGLIQGFNIKYNNSPAVDTYTFDIVNSIYLDCRDVYMDNFAGAVRCGSSSTKAQRVSFRDFYGNPIVGDQNGVFYVRNGSAMRFEDVTMSDGEVNHRENSLFRIQTISGGLVDTIWLDKVSLQCFSQDQAFLEAGMDTATTGTGTLTLGSALGSYSTFATAGIVDGQTVAYRIDDGANWELGTGTYTSSGTTLSRDTVHSSSSAGSKINVSGSGVEVTLPPDGKEYGLTMSCASGTLVNIWVTNCVFDHVTSRGLYMSGSGAEGFTNINITGTRFSSDNGTGALLAHAGSGTWRDIDISQNIFIMDGRGAAVRGLQIQETSTGTYYDCSLENNRISEINDESRGAAIYLNADGWNIMNNRTASRSGTSPGFTYGLQIVKTDLARTFIVGNNFYHAATGGILHPTYSPVSDDSRMWRSNNGPSGAETES